MPPKATRGRMPVVAGTSVGATPKSTLFVAVPNAPFTSTELPVLNTGAAVPNVSVLACVPRLFTLITLAPELNVALPVTSVEAAPRFTL